MTRRTQTSHTVIQPFMARFRMLSARTVGRPPFLEDGGGTLSVLYVSNTFKKRKEARNTGTINGMVGIRCRGQPQEFDVFKRVDEEGPG